MSLMAHIKAGLFSHQKQSYLETFLKLPYSTPVDDKTIRAGPPYTPNEDAAIPGLLEPPDAGQLHRDHCPGAFWTGLPKANRTDDPQLSMD